MPSTREIDRELSERLYDLLLIKREMPPGTVNKALDRAISRVRSAMTKEQIAWVEEEVATSSDS